MIAGIIPARYASTRFPGKSLIDIQGKSMIRRVYEQAAMSKSLDKLVVATDDERIFKHVESFGGEVSNHDELFDLGEVKIVLNDKMEALYFSRMVIPFIKGAPEKDWHKHFTYHRHVGMYAYRRDVLEKISLSPVSSLEQAESLEQLRWLEHGFKIKCVITHFESHCIDTPEDVEKVLRRMGK